MGNYYSPENAKRRALEGTEEYLSSGEYIKKPITEEIVEKSSKDYLRTKTREIIWLTAQVRFRNKFGHNIKTI